MAEGKRYYWLKLYDDIFESKRIKKMRKQSNGDTLFVIYLKLQFLAIKHNGTVHYDGVEDSFAEELALDIDEDADTIEQALNYLIKYELVEARPNGEYYFPYADANTGSETASAQRQRDFRERHKTLDKCDNVTPKCDNVTTMSQSRNGEIDIEIDIEKDIEIDNRDRDRVRGRERERRKQYANPFLTKEMIGDER